MKKVLFYLIPLFVLSACNDDDILNDVNDEQIDVVTDFDSDNMSQSVEISQSVALIAGDNSQIYSSIVERCIEPADISSAEIAIVAGSAFTANDAPLEDAYNRGTTIAVVNPDLETLSQWCGDNNISFVADKASSILVYAFNNRGVYYTMNNNIAEDYDGKYDMLSNSFASWVNNDVKLCETIMSRSTSAAEVEEMFDCQNITQTFSIAIENGILATVALSKPDKLTKYSTIDVMYKIYPIHAFNTAMAPGDYYLVDGTVVVHNGNMFNGYWTSKHGGVYARLCGYYLSSLEFSSKLTGATNVKFPAGATPAPGTTIGSTTYVSGFSWGISGNLGGSSKVGVSSDGGISGESGMTTSMGFSLNWSNSTRRDLSDVDIKLNTQGSEVKYNFDIQNLPTSAGLSNKKPAIPSVATSDMTMNFSWVWYVPEAKDYSNNEYKLAVSVKPIYKGYHWYSSAADFKELTFPIKDDVRQAAINLVAPNRIPTGQITLTNSSKVRQYVEDIKIWKASNNSETPDYVISETIASNSNASNISNTETSIVLPVGKYRIEGTMYNMNLRHQPVGKIKVSCPSYEVKIGETHVLDYGTGDFRVAE